MNDSLEALRENASRGDAGAMATLGKRLVAEQPIPAATEEGVAWLTKATDAGNGEAATFLAVINAAAIGRPQNWNAALDLLHLAASRGWRPAVRQLVALADAPDVRDGDDLSVEDINAMRVRLNVEALLQTPERQVLCEAPRIRRFDGFLSDRLCDWVTSSARPRLQRARIYDDAAEGGTESGSRTNSDASIELLDLDLITLLIRSRIAKISNVPLFTLEQSTVLHYDVGEQFSAHHDYLDPSKPAHAAEMRASGQRLATCLVYLNDDYDGAETSFPNIDQRFRGGKGDALLFANVDLQGRPDPATLHEGLAPTRGEKWVLSQWIRSSPLPHVG